MPRTYRYPKKKTRFAYGMLYLGILYAIFFAFHIVAGNAISPNIADVQRTLERSSYLNPIPTCPADPAFQVAYGHDDDNRR